MAKKGDKPGLLEKIFTVIVIILSTSAILNLVRTSTTNANVDAAEDSGDSILPKIVWGIVYVIVVIYLTKTKGLARSFKWSFSLTALLAFAVLSILWSDYPDVAYKYIISLIGTCLFSYYISLRYELIELLKLAGIALCIAAVGSVLTAIILPQYGIMHGGGALNGNWRGLYSHKNNLGRAMTLFMMVAFILYNYEKKLIYIGWAILALALLVLSKSTTSLASVLFIVFWGIYVRVGQTRKQQLPFFILTLTPMIILTGLFVANYELILTSIGKDPTLTGRTDLWRFLIPFGMQKGAFGYGVGSFWVGAQGPSGKVWQVFVWQPPEAHNGYIDLFLSTGLLGLTLFAVTAILNLAKYYKKYLVEKDIFYFWGVVFLTFTLIYNTSESSILRYNNIVWIFFIFTIISYHKREKQGHVVIRDISESFANQIRKRYHQDEPAAENKNPDKESL